MKFSILFVMGGLAQLAFAAPAAKPVPEVLADPEADISPASPLIKRGGYHRASMYTSPNCSGQPVQDVENFGCGGTCYPVTYGYSILLRQETTGNPKPTASCFYTTDCTGDHASAGIWSGYLTGCTRNEASNAWKSCYLYFDC